MTVKMNTQRLARMIASARACLGTPFAHQGRLPMVGLDCIGLVVVALTAAGCAVKDETSYAPRPDGISLIRAIEEHGGVCVSDIQAGDILVFRYDQQPQHVALALSGTRLIHSFAPAGKVVETDIGAYWRRRLVAIYRFDFEEKE